MLSLLLERHENIALADVGAFVQRLISAGARLVVVTILPDGLHCTVSVQRE